MENELINIQMTSEEYESYRNYQKELLEFKKAEALRKEQILSLRDQYYNEFKERQDWAKRAINAEKTLDKLLDVVHSDMPAKFKLEALAFEIEKIYKDKGYKK